MPKLEIDGIEPYNGTSYPAPFDAPVTGRSQRRLGQIFGLSHLGANLVTLQPGAWSSQRHWHHDEDEFLIMLAGKATLIEDDGETVLTAGDMAAWPAGVENGHHIVNRSLAECTFLCLSAGDASRGGIYPDIDMTFSGAGYHHRDGTPYPPRKPA
jgi:uncharacterized cupin superfamily protein